MTLRLYFLLFFILVLFISDYGLLYYNTLFAQTDDLEEDQENPFVENTTITADTNASSSKFAITNNVDFLIQMRSRKFTPDPGINVTAITQQQKADNNVHFLLQLYELPTFNETKSLEEQGIVLLNYLTGNTYIASANLSDIPKLSQTKVVRWAGPLEPADKISEDLKLSQIGEWARADNDQVVLTIQFHNDVNISESEDRVERLGGNVTAVAPDVPSITAVFSLGQVQNIALEDSVQYVDVVSPPLEGNNDGAVATSNVSPLYSSQQVGSAQYPGLRGTGVIALVYDADVIDRRHPDFRNRVVQGQDTAPVPPNVLFRNHATHVAATLGGSGSNSAGMDSSGNPNGGTPGQWAGIAPAILFRSFGLSGSADVLYDSGGDLNNDFTFAIRSGIDLATMSLGNNVVKNGFTCTLLGDYVNTAILIDNIVKGSINGVKIPYFQSSGNERELGAPCGMFSTISSPATSKNGIAVGATESNDNSMTPFSSWGPTDDGRLKPDIVGPGCQIPDDGGITSASFENPNGARNGYIVLCGTSMATPVAAGTGALLLEQWKKLQDFIIIAPSYS